MTLPITKRPNPLVSSAIATTLACILTASVITSALAPRTETPDTSDRSQSYKPSSGHLYRLSPIPPGADWTS